MKAVINNTAASNKLTSVKELPIPKPSNDEILIKAVAFGANPTDWKGILWGYAIPNAVSGSDVSGIVEEVGKNVKGFKKGDVVASMLYTGSSSTNGAFAEYVVASPLTTIRFEDGKKFPSEPLKTGNYPSAITSSFEAASSLPLVLSTVGFSFANGLRIKPDPSKAILIWSGASSVGMIAIQVAKIVYGLQVITTASAKHEKYLKDLGADAVFDYKDSDVVSKIKEYSKGSIAYAYDTFSDVASMQAIYDATADSKNVVIDNLLNVRGEQLKQTEGRNVEFSYSFVYQALKVDFQWGEYKFPYTDAIGENFDAFWEKVPALVRELKHNNLKVLSSGLESTNEAFDLLKDNKVSGEKVVWHI